jgi:hypothetical protein
MKLNMKPTRPAGRILYRWLLAIIVFATLFLLEQRRGDAEAPQLGSRSLTAQDQEVKMPSLLAIVFHYLN